MQAKVIPGFYATSMPKGPGEPIYKAGTTYWIDLTALKDDYVQEQIVIDKGTVLKVSILDDAYLDDIYVSLETVRAGHSVLRYINAQRTGELTDNRVIVYVDGFHMDLVDAIRNRFPDIPVLGKANKISLALAEDICTYALELMQNIDFAKSKYRFTHSIVEDTKALLVLFDQYKRRGFYCYKASLQGCNSEYLRNRRTCSVAQEQSSGTGDWYQPELPCMPAPVSGSPSTAEAELVPEETVLEEIVRSNTGNTIKDVERSSYVMPVSEVRPIFTKTPEFKVSLVITKVTHDGTGSELLTPVMDAGLIPKSFTVSDTGVAEVKVQASLPSISALLNSLKA